MGGNVIAVALILAGISARLDNLNITETSHLMVFSCTTVSSVLIMYIKKNIFSPNWIAVVMM